jgi:hypothetical protein
LSPLASRATLVDTLSTYSGVSASTNLTDCLTGLYGFYISYSAPGQEDNEVWGPEWSLIRINNEKISLTKTLSPGSGNYNHNLERKKCSNNSSINILNTSGYAVWIVCRLYKIKD